MQKVNKEVETYKKRLENAQTLMLDGELDASDYKGIKAKMQPEIEKLERLQSRLNEKNPEEDKIVEWGLYFLQNMPKLFTTATLEGKYRFLGSTFPKKLVFENGQVRTINEDDFLTKLLKSGATFSRLKNKGSDKSDPLSHRVSLTDKISNQFKEFSNALYPLKKIFAEKNLLSGKANVVKK